MTSIITAQSQNIPQKKSSARTRPKYRRNRAEGSNHSMPARKSDTESNKRKGPRKVSRILKFTLGATRLTPCRVNHSTRRESHSENIARANASNAIPIQRHNGVPTNSQLTSGRGRCLSITEVLVCCAMRGIRATLSEENSQT